MTHELGPGNAIWTVIGPETGTTLQITPGIGNPRPRSTPRSLSTTPARFLRLDRDPRDVLDRRSWRVRAADPVRLQAGSSWTGFKNVAGTETNGTDIGLVKTSSGVRLTAPSASNELPAVAKWTGHAFTALRRSATTAPASRARTTRFADASGRLAGVSNECGKFAVYNLPATTHAGIVRFSGGDVAAGDPQIATLPRGYAWVVWTVQYSSNAEQGDKVKIAPILLPGLAKKASHRGPARHGHGHRPDVLPAQRQPRVGVTGHGKHGWKVASRKLTLSGKKLGHALNGAALTPGKKYALKGTVVFSNGHSHSTVKATLTFRSCPNP